MDIVFLQKILIFSAVAGGVLVVTKDLIIMEVVRFM